MNYINCTRRSWIYNDGNNDVFLEFTVASTFMFSTLMYRIPKFIAEIVKRITRNYLCYCTMIISLKFLRTKHIGTWLNVNL